MSLRVVEHRDAANMFLDHQACDVTDQGVRVHRYDTPDHDVARFHGLSRSLPFFKFLSFGLELGRFAAFVY